MTDELTGSESKAGIGLSGTWATADDLGANDLIDGFQITQGVDAEELAVSPIGSGLSMKNTAERGAESPQWGIEGPLRYNGAEVQGISAFFGSETASSHGNSAYGHSILFNADLSKYITLALQAVTGSVMEYPTGVATALRITGEAGPQYVQMAMDVLANKRELGSAVNTFSDLDSLTAADDERVLLAYTDSFLINAQAGGALAASDLRRITNFEANYERGHEHTREAKGSAGLGVPIAVGDFPFLAQLTVNFRTLEDFTFFTANANGTEYKALVQCTGTVIGGTRYRQLNLYFPRLRVIQDPEWGLTEPGHNGLAVTFECLAASSVPTGMLDEMPHIVIINDRSTSYQA